MPRAWALPTARKIAMLCWQLATQGTQYAFAQPSLVAHKHRQPELAPDTRHPRPRGTHRDTPSQPSATRGGSDAYAERWVRTIGRSAWTGR